MAAPSPSDAAAGDVSLAAVGVRLGRRRARELSHAVRAAESVAVNGMELVHHHLHVLHHGAEVGKLEYVHLATCLDDLKVPPGNRLHALRGDRKGQHAIAVNDQWRLCFRFVDGDAYEVEVCDYS